MKALTVHCDNCGAPLDIPEGAERVTCRFCESPLNVIRTESVVTTQLVEELHARLEDAENQIEIMKLRQRLRELDRRWESYRDGRTQNGKFPVPTSTGSRVAIRLGLILVAMAALDLLVGPTPMIAFTSSFGIMLVVGGLITLGEAGRYESAARRFRRRRRSISRRIAALQGRSEGPA